MRTLLSHPRRLLLAGLTLLAGLGLATSAALGTAPAGASALGHRPGAYNGPVSATAKFSGFTSSFINGHGNFCNNPANAACDGNAGGGDYGTANRVDAMFNNGGTGNYASTQLPLLQHGTSTLPYHMIIDGSTAANQGAACPTAGTEGCTGPYMEKVTGGVNSQTVFPASGYTLTAYQYVDPSYSSAAGNGNGAGTQFDTDMGITQVQGGVASYGSDNIITTCNNGDGTTSLAFGHGSPGTCGTGSDITAAGWYRYVFLVSDNGGKVFLTARVLNESGSQVVFDSGPQAVSFDSGATQATTSETGGLRYLWWPTLNVDGLPVGYVNYSSGQQQAGHAS